MTSKGLAATADSRLRCGRTPMRTDAVRRAKGERVDAGPTISWRNGDFRALRAGLYIDHSRTFQARCAGRPMARERLPNEGRPTAFRSRL